MVLVKVFLVVVVWVMFEGDLIILLFCGVRMWMVMVCISFVGLILRR